MTALRIAGVAALVAPASCLAWLAGAAIGRLVGARRTRRAVDRQAAALVAETELFLSKVAAPVARIDGLERPAAAPDSAPGAAARTEGDEEE